MVLFHGTPKSRGSIIVREKIISCNAKLMHEDKCEEILKTVEFSSNLIKPETLATTPGYVYLTDSMFLAAYYGNKNAIRCNEDYFFLFKVELSEDVLEPDEDEIRMVLWEDPKQYPNAMDSLRVCHSVRYSNDIISFVYCVLPTTKNFSEPLSNLVMNMIYQRPSLKEANMSQKSVDLLNQFHRDVEWIKV